jgi:hypothetical protein
VGFSQSSIVQIYPPVWTGADLLISWQSTSPAGTWFQIYLNRTLAWWGQQQSAAVPMPTTLQRIDVGTVLAGEETTSYAADPPTLYNYFAELQWLGGTFESQDIQGFYVYGASQPGAAVNFAAPLATIQAYTPGVVTDGYGLGGFGYGGWGEAAATYGWVSGALTSGTWNYAVAPFDTLGNVGPALTISVVIAVPPLEPPFFPGTLTRLEYTYDPLTYEVTLHWEPSPG